MRTGRQLIPGLDRFGTLLFFLLIAFLLPGTSNSDLPKVGGAVANIAALGAGFAATGMWAQRRRFVALVITGAIGLTLVGALEQTSVLAGFGALTQVVVLGAILGAVVRRVLTHDEVGPSTILGVISAYVLIGMVFAWLYLALHGFRDGPILDPEATALPVYYSFVVLTTLGFGDVSPIDEFVRRITALEAMTGQIFLATIVARFVSMYKGSEPKP